MSADLIVPRPKCSLTVWHIIENSVNLLFKGGLGIYDYSLRSYGLLSAELCSVLYNDFTFFENLVKPIHFLWTVGGE